MLRRILVSAFLSGALALPIAAANADDEPRYSEWRTDGAEAAEDSALHALARELEALIDEGERARAADPRFLQDLRDKIAAHAAAAAPRAAPIRDDFADGDFTDDPRWTVVSGDFAVDRELGLRTVVAMAHARMEASGDTLDTLINTGKSALDKGKSVLDDLLSDEEKAREDTGPSDLEPAEIYLAETIGNAFTLEIDLTSRVAAEGAQFEIDLFRGTTRGSGYRLSYLPGGDPGLRLSRFGRRGVVAIGEHGDALTLEDGHGHRLVLARGGDGTMTAAVDGTELIRVKSSAFTDPFDGVSLVNGGGDYAIREIAVHGRR